MTRLEGMKVRVPTVAVLVPSVLEALRDNSGEATLQEIEEFVVRDLTLTDRQVRQPHSLTGKRTELDYRLAWTRSRLRKDGKIRRVARGIWALTESSA